MMISSWVSKISSKCFPVTNITIRFPDFYIRKVNPSGGPGRPEMKTTNGFVRHGCVKTTHFPGTYVVLMYRKLSLSIIDNFAIFGLSNYRFLLWKLSITRRILRYAARFLKKLKKKLEVFFVKLNFFWRSRTAGLTLMCQTSTGQ
jgi:hypothetical protein